MVTSIGPGAESVGIDIYAAGPTGARWDRAAWDGAPWATQAWQPVGCDVREVTYRWGASDQVGVLSIAQAGELDIGTFDPRRQLDPLNTSSPFYGYIRPGTAIRIVGLTPSVRPVATAYIDTTSHDIASATGRIRAIDGIAYLAQSELADGVALPNTLRARVRAIVAAVGLGSIVPVEPEAPVDPAVDPPVSPYDGKGGSAWVAITDAALDALTFVWVDPTGVLRFRSFGALPDAPVSIGCPPDDADAGDIWLAGVESLESVAAADAVRNSVRAYSSGTIWAPALTDGASIAKYGVRPFDIERVIPDLATWQARVIADRADAGLEVGLGQVRPYTLAELDAMLATGLIGPSIIRVRDDEHGELIDLDVSLFGEQIGVTPAGWRFEPVTAISRVEWDAIEPPVIPPEPPVDPWHVETRTYIGTSDALIALTSGGAQYGAGASSSLPFGTWQGWTYRGLLRFPSIPWTKVRALRTATLKVTTSTQVRVGFGSSPKTQIRRITQNWSAGSSSSPSGGNAVVWPGPGTTSTGQVTASLGTAQSAQKAIRVDALVRAWAPSSAGGSGAGQYGLRLGESSSSGSNTGEVWPVEQGGSARPVLELVVEVFD